MPIVAVFEFPDGTIEQYKQVMDEGGDEVRNQPNRLSHICFATNPGFTVIDVWQDEASFGAFGEIIGPLAASAGFDPKPQVFPLVATGTQSGEWTFH